MSARTMWVILRLRTPATGLQLYRDAILVQETLLTVFTTEKRPTQVTGVLSI